MKPPLRIDPSPPSFHPHITLGSFPSSTPVDELENAIPQLSEALDIAFESLEAGDHFFRSVYIAVKHTEQLSGLHRVVHDKLNVVAKTPRFPHLSLYYIQDEQANIRQDIVDNMMKSGRVTNMNEGAIGFSTTGAENDLEASGDEEHLSGFRSTEVWIVDCDGPVQGWHVLKKVPLT